MFRAFHKNCKREGGFTLIELMIVVAIIGILAAIAVPNFVTYRNKSRVSASIGSIESIRAAMASYAADSTGNGYPAAIADFAALKAIADANGTSLKADETAQGFDLTSYTAGSIDATGIVGSYTMVFKVSGVPDTLNGVKITVSPSGLEKGL